MTDLRFRPAYISVAVSRSTEPRCVVETLEELRHRQDDDRARLKHGQRAPRKLMGFLIHRAAGR